MFAWYVYLYFSVVTALPDVIWCCQSFFWELNFKVYEADLFINTTFIIYKTKKKKSICVGYMQGYFERKTKLSGIV